ncbi:hypothetical protein [Kineococcus rhizosphaerae]|uniref:Uncharacterized protein n=1 Tax=Kineococcus rhizosphaerae TaxID=559628 RepID=A0A2T0QQ03_9ACTN|nr:hypothetical protein [Kineococcus rhizosphaerae]PRY06795.1 hypothetical protein CLV37_1329 [Kineococcus rhizosphaerae]
MAQTPQPDAALVQTALEQLIELAAVPEEFTGALVDNVWWIASAYDEAGGALLHDINAEEWATTVAFRQEPVIRHSLKAARRCLQNVEKDVQTPQTQVSAQLWQLHVQRYVNELRRLEQVFQTVLDGVIARDQGVVRPSPNPRRRAEHEIAQRNLFEDIPRGEIVKATARQRRKR